MDGCDASPVKSLLRSSPGFRSAIRTRQPTQAWTLPECVKVQEGPVTAATDDTPGESSCNRHHEDTSAVPCFDPRDQTTFDNTQALNPSRLVATTVTSSNSGSAPCT